MRLLIHSVVAVACLLLATSAAEAQQSGRPRALIGVLSPLPAVAAARNNEAFRQALEKLGYSQGRDYAIEARYADGAVERLADLAAELVALKPDVILSGSPAGALAAAGATRTIPIVAVGINDIVQKRFVTSLARPGGNITGFAVGADDTSDPKFFELLADAVPGLARVGVMLNPDDMVNTQTSAPHSLGLTTKVYEVRTPLEIEPAIAAATQDGMQALNLGSNTALFGQRDKVAQMLLRARLPAIYSFPEFARAGGLMSYGSSLPDLYRRAADYVYKILKGTKPGDLPVQLPTKFDLIVNLKTATAIGITVPQSFLLRADEVIE